MSDTTDCSTVASTVELLVDRECQQVANVPDGQGGTVTLAYKANPVPENPHCMHSYQEYESIDDCNAGKVLADGSPSLTLPALLGTGNTDAKKNANCAQDSSGSNSLQTLCLEAPLAPE